MNKVAAYHRGLKSIIGELDEFVHKNILWDAQARKKAAGLISRIDKGVTMLAEEVHKTGEQTDMFREEEK